MKYPIITIAIILLFSSFSAAGELSRQTSQLEQEKNRISYSLGYQIGSDYKKQKKTIDSQAFLQGMRDSSSDTPPAIAQESMTKMLVAMKKRVMAEQREEQQEIQEKFHAIAEKFFADNAKKEGLIVLPSGLQYKKIRSGTGKKPALADRVTVHYKGTLLDGTEFGGTHNKKEPQSFYVNGVIPGLTEGLQLMQEGAKWEFFVPAALAYGRRGALADRAVIFELELLSIEAPE
ncbi:MAG: FKBP-type peptidyl-prolyl cis-trans isomerase [Thermodesulfobacteriota bacterium]